MNTPHTVDLNVNGVCNLKCPWCWGPEHSKAIESLTDDEWCDIIQFLAEQGTESFVFTGGEPLMKVSLRRLLRQSFELGNRNTLSTNGILLATNRDVLDLIHDIGIPLDGSDAVSNQKMRVGSAIHFQRALESLRLIQESYPYLLSGLRVV